LALPSALAAISAGRYAANANPPQITLQKSRSGTIGSQTVVVSGDEVGQISFEGSDGTAFKVAANITAAVDGTPGNNDMPGRLVFSTTADGASSPTERMRIDSAGNVTFRTGTTPDRNGSGTAFVDSSGSGSPVYLYFKKTFSGSRDAIDFNHNGTSVGQIQFTNTATAYKSDQWRKRCRRR
jgi:hypothetical protein